MLVPYTPGPIASFNQFPLIGPGPTGPLLFNPGIEATTPEIQRMGVGRAVTFRQWGFPPGHIPQAVADLAMYEWANGPDQVWGMGRATAQLNDFDQYAAPAAASEVLQPFDRQRCVVADTLQIVPTGVAYELARQDIPAAAVGIIESLPTTFQVEALDDAGLPVFTYGSLNGEDPCLDRIVHIDPLVSPPLTWQWSIVTTHNSALDDAPDTLLGPIQPGQIPGDRFLEPWSDMRTGNRASWPLARQMPTHPRKTVRVFITLFGPPNRFRVRVGARVSGYWQVAGRRGSALRAATDRY